MRGLLQVEVVGAGQGARRAHEHGAAKEGGRRGSGDASKEEEKKGGCGSGGGCYGGGPLNHNRIGFNVVWKGVGRGGKSRVAAG